ncbi:hypothetical protein CCR95_04205 [Thiocystis minor]|uniref:restriction endonuclease subunit S n=1 Tax=Thiocystis minor TaxID=61597 RepID=UPI00191345E9|nr:restriction endonuclease subunit S [Thiocystis minor]MBK5963312.1 hypothetical protein [Thiocystis minor]
MKFPSVRLAEVAIIERDGIDASEISSNTEYLGLEHIESGGRILGSQKVLNGELASTKFRFGSKHILYGKLRPYLAKIALPDFEGICSTDILPINSGPRIDRRFLAHFLRQPSMVDFAASRATGANLPRLNPKVLAEFEIPLPPVEEQKRIAAILDQIDSLRRLRQSAIDRLNSLGQAIFDEMFVKDRGAHSWPVSRVADVAKEIRTGPFGSQLLHSEFVDEGIAVLGIDNAVNNEFRWSKFRYISPEKYRDLKRYTVRPGDVLITIMGTCGRCAIVPDDIDVAINTKHLCCISLQQELILPGFLHAAFLMHPALLKQLGVQAKGAVMPGLNMNIIKSLKLCIPPIDLQRKYVERISIMTTQKQNMLQHMAGLDSLFAASQQRAFNGEL